MVQSCCRLSCPFNWENNSFCSQWCFTIFFCTALGRQSLIIFHWLIFILNANVFLLVSRCLCCCFCMQLISCQIICITIIILCLNHRADPNGSRTVVYRTNTSQQSSYSIQYSGQNSSSLFRYNKWFQMSNMAMVEVALATEEMFWGMFKLQSSRAPWSWITSDGVIEQFRSFICFSSSCPLQRSNQISSVLVAFNFRRIDVQYDRGGWFLTQSWFACMSVHCRSDVARDWGDLSVVTLHTFAPYSLLFKAVITRREAINQRQRYERHQSRW